MPVQTDAADPPDEPPGVRSMFQGVACDAPAVRSGPGPQRQLGNIGLTDDRGASLAEPTHDFGIPVAHAAIGSGTPRRGLAGDVGVVLDRDRNPGQREDRQLLVGQCVDSIGCSECLVGHHDTECVDHRFELPDASKRRLG
jgi:hypothetical protein